jgi:hypothetical protein
MKVEYQSAGLRTGPLLVVTGESTADTEALDEFARGARPSRQLRLTRSFNKDSGGDVDTLTLATDSGIGQEDLPDAYGPHGWSDRITDESAGSLVRQWEYTLDVRPSDPTSGVLHGFIARVLVTTSEWNGDAKGGWAVVDGPSLVYHGEHESLASGVSATRKAAKRAWILRDGPEDES